MPPLDYFNLCTDLDGVGTRLGAGDAGLSVFLSSITAVRGPAIRLRAMESLILVCAEGCSEHAEGYLSTACDKAHHGRVHTMSFHNYFEQIELIFE